MLAMMPSNDSHNVPRRNMTQVIPTSSRTRKPAPSALYAEECPYQEVTDSALWAANPAKTCPRKGPWHSKLRLTKKEGYISHFCTTCVKELWREEVEDEPDEDDDYADAYDAYGGAYGAYDSEYEY